MFHSFRLFDWKRCHVQEIVLSYNVAVKKKNNEETNSQSSQFDEEDLQKLVGDGGNNACGSSIAGGKVYVKLTSSSKTLSQFSNFKINLTLVTFYSLFTKFCYLPFENLVAKILLTNFAVLSLWDNESFCTIK